MKDNLLYDGDNVQAFTLTWAQNRYQTLATFKHMLQCMGGLHYSYTMWSHEFASESKNPKKDPNKLMEGFRFIAAQQKNLKLTDIDNRLRIWTETQNQQRRFTSFGAERWVSRKIDS